MFFYVEHCLFPSDSCFGAFFLDREYLWFGRSAKFVECGRNQMGVGACGRKLCAVSDFGNGIDSVYVIGDCPSFGLV